MSKYTVVYRVYTAVRCMVALPSDRHCTYLFFVHVPLSGDPGSNPMCNISVLYPATSCVYSHIALYTCVQFFMFRNVVLLNF